MHKVIKKKKDPEIYARIVTNTTDLIRLAIDLNKTKYQAKISIF